MSMLHTAIFTIPKTGHLFFFILGLLGVFCLLRNKHKSPRELIILIFIIIPIVWRILFQISTPRYAIILIYPFAFFATFFVYKIVQSLRAYFFVILFLLCICFIINIYKDHSNKANLAFVSEFHDKLYSKNECNALLMAEKDVFRTKLLEKHNNRFEVYDSNFSTRDLIYFVDTYTSIGKTTYIDFVLDSEMNPYLLVNNPKCKPILSFFSGNNKKKRHFIFELKTLPPRAVPPQF